LCDLHHKYHCDRIELRNTHFPVLWRACVAFEAARAKHHDYNRLLAHQDMVIGALRKEKADLRAQKADLSEVTDKLNAANTEKKCLADTRDKYKSECVDVLWSARSEAKKEYDTRREAYHAALKAVSDLAKSLGYGPNNHRRKELPTPEYAEGSWEFAYQTVSYQFGRDKKALGARYQAAGLHSGIRGEISTAVDEMEFTCSDRPRPAPYNTLPLQFKKTAKKDCPTFAELEQRCQGLKLTYLGSGAGKRGDCYLYEVEQQIGTSGKPRTITYELMMHRPWPKDAKLQRWALRLRDDREYVSIILSREASTEPDTRPTSYVANDYSMGRMRDDGGLSVAHFVGEHINEEVYIPSWLVNKFRAIEDMDAAIDASAGKLLTDLDGSLRGDKLVTIRRLAETSMRAQEWLAWRSKEWSYRNKLHRQATRAREHIFQVAVARISRLHTHLIEDQVEIAELKRKKTRDRAKGDGLRDETRRNATIAAPGELRKFLRASGMIQDIKVGTANASRICQACRHENQTGTESKIVRCEKCNFEWDRDVGACLEHLSRGGVVLEYRAVARKTDVVTTYIASLGVKTGPMPYQHVGPSWIRRLAEAA
jgi:hypothetical protein